MPLRRIPVSVSQTPPDDLPASVYEKIAGGIANTEHRGNLAAGVEQTCEGEAMFLRVGEDEGRILVDGYANDYQALVLIFLVKLFESDPLPRAVRSPCGPEIEHDYFALMIFYMETFVVDVF